MQVIFEDENERSNGREVNSIDVAICAGRVGRYIEREYIERVRIRRSRI